MPVEIDKPRKFVRAGYAAIEDYSSKLETAIDKVKEPPLPEPGNEVNIKLYCTKAELKSLQTGVWQLGSTDKEAAVSNWNTTETPEGDSLLRMLCFESEAKTLHHDLFLNCGHSASYEVKPNAKGSNQVNAEFFPVKFAIQIGENRLGWATSGYFYHFIDSQLVREYKVVGKGSWTCQATRSDKAHLTDELISEHHIGSFLLPYRIEGEIFSEQHILYREVKLTADELAKADSTWLSENAMKLNLESIIAIRYNELLYREPEQKDASPVERQKVSHSVQINPTTGERETWPEIANQYGLSAKDLLDLNPAYHDDPMRLKAGDNLQVSKAVVHEPVESSETPSPIVSLSNVHAFGDVWGRYNQSEFGDKAVNIFPTSSIEDHVPVLKVCRIDVPVSFSLGWMQIEQTQSQAQLWAGLFTEETSESQQQLIKNYNVHLNEPVRQGEIVILLTAEPENDSQKQALNQLLEEAQAASTELGKLNEEQVATANRHFELLDYYASEALRRVKADGLPSDEYAYASVGVGAVASGVGQHLNNINGVLQEINNLYVSQVALGSRSGGINYGQFVNERAALFKKLDGSFARLSSRSIQLPINQQIRRALNLSTKSIVHNADEIIAKGIVPNLGKRMANVAHGISAAKGVGYVGLALGGASAAKNIHDACSVNEKGQCGKTSTREVTGFLGGLYGGTIGGDLAAAGTVLVLGVVGVTSAPVLAVAAVSAFVVGGAVGGVAGAAAGKSIGDFMYETTIDIKESVEETMEGIF